MGWFKDLMNTVFPDTCLACHSALRQGEPELCTSCRLALPLTNHHKDHENEFWKKFSATLPIAHALAYLKFQKRGVTQKIVHALKYYQNQEIGIMVGKWHGSVLHEEGYRFDLILPVPLHKSRLAKRGYNQSDCFAEGLAASLQTNWSATLLKRNKATETQTRKERHERWANVANIFEVTNPQEIKGRNIAIVDDVVTTGSTLDTCARAVLAYEPKSISLIAIAVAGEL